jgi:Phosphotransferase enzyme family
VTDDEPEELLRGGLANAGKVVRVGSTVRRPFASNGPAVVAFLSHLAEVGFEGVPRFHGIDPKGRGIFDYVEGDVDRDTNPVWARNSDALLASVARLQRRLHDAARSFNQESDAVWDRGLAAPSPWTTNLVSHNDLCISNVVVRDGAAAAFIDFDFAAPTHPLWDVAVALRHWVPVKASIDDEPTRRLGLDQVERFRSYCDVYGARAGDRELIVEMLGVFLDQALVSMRTRFEAGIPAYVEIWVNGGYPEQNRRSRTWVTEHARRLIN